MGFISSPMSWEEWLHTQVYLQRWLSVAQRVESIPEDKDEDAAGASAAKEMS